MIQVAIIGSGGIADAHIEGYLTFKEKCKVVALADIYPEKAEAINTKYQLGAQVYDSYQKLAEQEDIQLVSVCTPPYTHAEITVCMLEHGKDVLLEKPMASSLEECDHILDAMKRTGRRVSVVSQNRFKTPISNTKKLLDSGAAGKVVHAQVDSVWWRAKSYYDLWWRGTWEKEGGGCTLNHAVHHIDMLCWIMGLPKEVTSYLANLQHHNSEVEDYSNVISRYENGALSVLTSSLVHHGEDQKFVFQCEKAKLQSPWDVYASKAKPNGFFEKNEELTLKLDQQYRALPELTHQGHTGQIEDVLTALEEGREFMVTAQHGKNAIEYITAVYKSWFEHKTVSLPLPAGDKWRTRDGILSSIEKFYEKTGHVENFSDQTISV